MSDAANPMLSPSITKVTVNIGVGEGGRRLQLAERVLEVLTAMKPMRTISAKTNRDLGTRKGAPIGCKVTMRNPEAVEAFRDLLVGRAGQRLATCVHLDSGDDALVGKDLWQRAAIRGALAEGLLEADRARDVVAEPIGCEKHGPVVPTAPGTIGRNLG